MKGWRFLLDSTKSKKRRLTLIRFGTHGNETFFVSFDMGEKHEGLAFFTRFNKK